MPLSGNCGSIFLDISVFDLRVVSLVYVYFGLDGLSGCVGISIVGYWCFSFWLFLFVGIGEFMFHLV